MPRKIFPKETIEELLSIGYNITQLAKYFKTSRSTMSKFLKENGLKTQKNIQLNRCKNINPLEVCDLYNQGKTILEISNLYGVSTTTIKNRLKINDIHIRTNSESHKKYSEDFNYFDNIDNYDKSYLLGFICADGWVSNRNELGIEVCKKDKDIIYWFKEQIKTDKPIIEKEKSYGLIVQNERITTTLNSYDIIPNKSLILNIGSVIEKANIKENFIPALLLGYFDGDGGIYKYVSDRGYIQYSASITGTFETCSYFKNYFNGIGFFTKRYKDDKNNYTYQIGGRNKVKECLSKLYLIKNEISFFYKRKYDIYCEL